MPRVRIPGVGIVAFPDSMSTGDIEAQAARMHAGADQAAHGYTGAPDQPIEANPLLNPVELLPGLFGLRGAVAGGAAAVRGAGRLLTEAPGALGSAATRLIARRIPGVGTAMDVAEAVGSLGGKASGAAEGRATAGLSERGAKEALDYWRRRGFAMMKEAGAPTEAAASKQAISGILGREVKSRAELSIEDWVKVHDAMVEQIAQQAAEKAAAKSAAAATKAGSKIAGRIGREPAVTPPAIGSAEARVAPAARPSQAMRGSSAPELARRAAARAKAVGRTTAQAPELGTDLTSALGSSLQLEQQMAAAGLTDAERAYVRSALRAAGP